MSAKTLLDVFNSFGKSREDIICRSKWYDTLTFVEQIALTRVYDDWVKFQDFQDRKAQAVQIDYATSPEMIVDG